MLNQIHSTQLVVRLCIMLKQCKFINTKRSVHLRNVTVTVAV